MSFDSEYGDSQNDISRDDILSALSEVTDFVTEGQYELAHEKLLDITDMIENIQEAEDYDDREVDEEFNEHEF